MSLKAGDMNLDELLQLYSQVTEKAYVWIEYPLSFFFGEKSKHDIKKELVAGRAFNAEGELKFQYIDGFYRVVLFGDWDIDSQSLSDHSQQLQGLTANEKTVYLWGEQTDAEPEWIESSIPQYLHYPIDPSPGHSRVRLSLKEYKDSSGLMQFYRFSNLKIEEYS